MKLYEHLRATVTASVDNAVSQIENHDAVIAEALEDNLAAAAKARSRLTRVHKDSDALKHKLALLQQSAEQWEERALSVVKKDEQKALQCLQRRNTRLQEAQQANTALIRHSELETSAASRVDRIEQQLEALTQQRRLMSQHSATEAQRIIDFISGQSASTASLDDSFDRWETRITELECSTGRTPPVDTLENEFITLENEAQLQSDLDALKRECSTAHVMPESLKVC